MGVLLSILSILHELPGWVLVSIGFYLAFRVLKFPDLTVDASFVVGGVAAASAAVHWQSSLAGLLLALLLGGLAGGATALVYLSNPRPAYKLVAGVLVVFAMYSLNWRLLERRADLGFSTQPTAMNWLAGYQARVGFNTLRPFTFLVGLILVSLAIVFFSYLLRTSFGLALRAIGSKPRLVSPVAIRRKFYLLVGLALCNMSVAVGGWFLASINGFADTRMFGIIVHALAAAIVGELIYEHLNPGRDRRVSIGFLLVAPIVGTVLYQFIRALMMWLLREQYSGIHGAEISINQQDANTIVAAALLGLILLTRYIAEQWRGHPLADGSEMEGVV